MFVLVVCGSFLLAAPVASAEAVDELTGLWVSEAVYGPRLRGELAISRGGDGWKASLAGVRTTFDIEGDDIRFAFAKALGKFRGKLARDGRRIEGFWLQPSGKTVDHLDPGGSGQSFATPIVLELKTHGEWRGEIVPLDDRFTFYLKIFRDEKREFVGAFRNPEMNAHGGASWFEISRRGEAVRFRARFDDGEEIVHDATLLASPERLKLFWPEAGGMLELQRRMPEEAPSFFPRPPGTRPYVYRKPDATNDGWKSARGRDVGIDEQGLERAVQKIIDGDPASRRPWLIHSLLVAHDGRLVLEEYFFGYDRETRHDLRSAGKTLASALLGIAMREGVDIAPETRVYKLFAGKGPFANPDPRKDEITLARLLTHSAGLDCDDNDEASPGREETMWKQAGEPDWTKYTLGLPMAHDPGVRYAYCSANINLVGAALAEATGQWLPEFFDRAIARPLQFERYHWNLTPTDEGYLGGGVFVRPRDLLKLGQTYLDGGTWNGRRIVDKDWVEQSTRPYMEISPETTGLSPEAFSNFYAPGKDGYAWHRYGVKVGDRVVEEYEATGNGGQILMVVPEYHLVVVFTGGNYVQGGIWGRWRDEIVGAEIIPAIRN